MRVEMEIRRGDRGRVEHDRSHQPMPEQRSPVVRPWTEGSLVEQAVIAGGQRLTWALLLLRPAGVDIAQWPSLSAYLARMQARPSVRDAIATEMELRKTVPANPA